MICKIIGPANHWLMLQIASSVGFGRRKSLQNVPATHKNTIYYPRVFAKPLH